VRMVGDGRGELAFGLHPGARGLGLATRAGRLVLDWAFEIAGLQAVIWQAAVGNWASRHVAAALGFRHEGVRRAALAQDGALLDAWTATLLPHDPRVSVAPPRQPVLRNDTVTLRPFVEDDLARIVVACADPLTQHWLTALPRGYGLGDAAMFLEWSKEGAAAFTHWNWCVTAPGSDDCLGAVSLSRLDHGSGSGELGYWAHPDARGRGVMGAAARLAADFALGELAGPGLPGDRLHRTVTIRVAPGNTASQAVARAAGAEPVGRLPEAERLGDGTWSDLLLFARVRGRTPESAG
ncbi:MAG: GNAT family N-acetyltransferase, partial [Propionibacteriaceae bacterium]|nr:GNAT family N-acetyltransferase [Propionibacteriaceae bacterium]